MTYIEILYLILSYLIGSIPFGLLISKIVAKKDIRKHGSKNIGATNVTRILGKKLGLLTLILDAFKGGVMVLIAQKSFCNLGDTLSIFTALVGFFAVLGHIFPIYLKFKGGKGVATSIAVILALDPLIGFVAIIAWLSVFVITRISAAAAIIAMIFTALFSVYDEAPIEQIILYIILLALILVRHKDNLTRIQDGTEGKL